MTYQYIDICVNPAKTEEETLKLVSAGLDENILSIIDASSFGSCLRTEKLLENHPELPLYGTAGIHPHNASSFNEEVKQELRRILKKPKFIAAGETGLDFDRMFSPKEDQIRALREQIELAEEMSMPMLLHEREAFEEFCSIFKDHPEQAKRSVLHCFTGDARQMETLLEMGFYIGITGWITDERRNRDLLEAVRILPKDRVLLETDSPYLRPRIKGLKGQNTPANVKYVAEALAKSMEIDREELRVCAFENTKRLFGI